MSPTMTLTLGEKIKLLRLRAGLSQDDIAEITKLSSNTVGRIEAGETSPRVDQLEAIAGALGGSLVVEIALEGAA